MSTGRIQGMDNREYMDMVIAERNARREKRLAILDRLGFDGTTGLHVEDIEDAILKVAEKLLDRIEALERDR